MKPKIPWSIIALISVFMVACTQSDGLVPEKTKGVRSTLTLHRVSPEQAKKRLAEFRSHLPKNKPGAKYSDYPVIMGGRQKNKSTGHAWVVDGYLNYTRTCYVNGVAHPERKTYLHCNWGWSGESNGYCLDSVLLPKPGSENPPENPGGNLTIDDGYSWEVKTLTYIRPRSNG